MAKILLTGSRGFLGALAKSRLQELGHSLVLLEDKQRWRDRIPELLKFRPEIILHLGFSTDFTLGKPDPNSLNVANTKLLGELAMACQTSHFIFISGAAVLGVSKEPKARNETNLNRSDFPRWLQSRYVQDKLAAESYLHSLALPKLTVLYLSTCYGPAMHPKALAVLRSNREKRIVFIPPGGSSFLGTEDFLDALELVLAKQISGSFVVSSGNCTYAEIFSAACRLQQRQVVIPKLLLGVLRRISRNAVLESSFGYKYYTAEKLQRSGWMPKQNLEACLQGAFSTD